MESGSEESTDEQDAVTFELSCNDCPFERTVDGSLYDALELAERHESQTGDVPTDHFVDFERAEGD